MAQKQAVRSNQAITLKGSTQLVTEFFEYSVNRCVICPDGRHADCVVSFTNEVSILRMTSSELVAPARRKSTC